MCKRGTVTGGGERSLRRRSHRAEKRQDFVGQKDFSLSRRRPGPIDRQAKGRGAEDYRRAIEGVGRRAPVASQVDAEHYNHEARGMREGSNEDALPFDSEQNDIAENKSVEALLDEPAEALVGEEDNQEVPQLLHSTSIASQEMTALKYTVVVQGVSLLVPVKRGDTVRKLAEGAANRYAAVSGESATLVLLSAEGARLHDDDVAETVLVAGSEVNAVVVATKVLPLAERYLAACSGRSEEPLSDLAEKLRQIDESNGPASLSVAWWALGPKKLSPVFAALSRHSGMTKLNLQGNRLGDAGLADLCQKAMTSMTQLQSLNLANNELTSESLNSLEAATSSLTSLTRLNLSYNLFDDGIADVMPTIVQQLPMLRHLGLASCGLTQNFARDCSHSLRGVEVNVLYNDPELVQAFQTG
jgi:hypothetical protein